jgi:sugar lactone lactonase YvrE
MKWEGTSPSVPASSALEVATTHLDVRPGGAALEACVLQAGDRLAEAPVWDTHDSSLIWVDHHGGTIRQARCDDTGHWRLTRQWECHRPIAAAIPNKGGGLLVVGGLEVVVFDEGPSETPFVLIDGDARRERFNEAKCDPQGRLWVGTLSLDFAPRAALYRIDPDRSVTKTLEHVTLSNGMAWSPDSSVFYYADTLTLRIDAFDFDPVKGEIRNRRTFARLERGAGGANGLTVDAEGCVWVALTGGAEIRRYAPDGSLLQQLRLPTNGPTSCAFGGPGGDQLFITTRSGRMPEVARQIGVPEEGMEAWGPLAGAVLVCRPGVTGPAGTPFASLTAG